MLSLSCLTKKPTGLSPSTQAGIFTPPKNHTPPKQQGFSLLELVATLIIIALLSSAAISRWSASSFNLPAQAEQLIADIRYIQSLSMTRGQRFRINFSADRYSLSNRDNSSTLLHPATNLPESLLDNNIILSTSHNSLVFDGNGTPYSDATLPGTALNSNATVTLTAGSESRTIQISPETGRVRLL